VPQNLLEFSGTGMAVARVSCSEPWASSHTTFKLYNLADLPVTWHDRLTKGTLELGWQTAKQAYHISSKGITQGMPRSFMSSMKPNSPDHKIWLESYHKELNGLKEQDTYSVITAKE
jgi:hypothetical protein